jgi:hypothetical protein
MEDLVGLWGSGPYDYGSMESSWLCLRPDGTGWSAYANAAQGASVSRLTWTCPRDGELELQYHWTVSGTWATFERRELPPDLVDVHDEGPDDSFVRSRYTIGTGTAPCAGQPVTGLHLDAHVDFATTFALVSRITKLDDPATDASTS